MAASLIVADLPADAHPELKRVQLVAPTTPLDRIRLAGERTDGWLYLVSVTGTTGARDELSPRLAELANRTRSVTKVRLVAGFGISTPEQAVQAATLVDGIVIGSAAIEVAEASGARGLRDYVAGVRSALDGAEVRRRIP